MKAIHNLTHRSAPPCSVVSDISKLQKWKQFTTSSFDAPGRSGLFPIFQSYKNESNSQLRILPHPGISRCFRYFKVTKMKAIHNQTGAVTNMEYVVSDISKLQKWKQFTTIKQDDVCISWLFPIFQSYKNESNSQHNHSWHINLSCCFRYFKVTKMKAIHSLN